MAEGEKVYNYLDAYRSRIDWSRISRCEVLEMDDKWEDNPLYKSSLARGFRTLRVLVRCPTHGFHRQVVSDPPKEDDFLCQRCISAEIDRLLNIRLGMGR